MTGESFETATPATIRLLPHSIESEEIVLSCCFMDGAEVLAKCQTAQLTSRAFYETKNGIVFDVMMDLHARQHGVEVYAVAEELKKRAKLDAVGGYAFLTQISASVPTTVQVGYHIEVVKKHERRRELIRQAVSLTENCYSGNEEATSADIERITAIRDNRESGRTWAQAVNEAEERTRDRMKPPEQRDQSLAELSWGIPDFDRYFNPIEAGELVVIGGYTSSGKSSLLRQVIWSFVMAGHASMIETVETLDREEAINLAAHISGIRSRARLHELHPKDQAELLAAFDKMRMPHFLVSHQEHSVAGMFSRARAFKRTQRLRALGTDYLQIMEDVNKVRTASDRAVAIAGVTAACKQFATKEELAVFLLSGFNREYIRNGNREPMLSDLEGGSAIEKDASRVLLLHIPTEYMIGGQKFAQSLTADSYDQPSFYVKVIQAKGRNQGTSSAALMFRRETKTFHPIAKEPAVEEQPEIFDEPEFP